MPLALNQAECSQRPPYGLLKARERDGQRVPRLGIIQEYLSLHTLRIEHFQQARRTLLKAELRQSQRLLRLFEQPFIKHLDHIPYPLMKI